MPFGKPGAYWLMLDSGIDLRHTSYNLDYAATRIKATSYPQAESFAQRNVLDPPSEETIIAAYAEVELK